VILLQTLAILGAIIGPVLTIIQIITQTYQPLNYVIFVVALGAFFKALADLAEEASEKEVKGKVSSNSVTLLFIPHHNSN
jgi:hypothetical protein